MEKHNKIIWEILSDSKVGMLVTSNNGKELSARPMHIVQDEYKGVLWFYTNFDSEKVEESLMDQVCVTFTDSKNGGYASLTGSASIHKDKALIDRFWNSMIAAWFPNGKNDPNVSVLRIDVNFGEYWKNNKSFIGTAFEMSKSVIQGKMPDLGENQKFNH